MTEDNGLHGEKVTVCGGKRKVGLAKGERLGLGTGIGQRGVEEVVSDVGGQVETGLVILLESVDGAGAPLVMLLLRTVLVLGGRGG